MITYTVKGARMSQTGVVAVPKKGEAEKYTQVKVDSSLVPKAKTIASHKGKTLADYVSDVVRDAIKKDYQQMHKDIGKELKDLD